MSVVTIDMALGGDDTRWVYLPRPGREFWLHVVGPDTVVMLLSLHAATESADLMHPGEVPVASETTLARLLETVNESLGEEATIHELAVLVPGATAVTMRANDERSLRLEASDDAAFAPFLTRVLSLGTERWVRILEALRAQLLTETHLRLNAESTRVTVEVHDRPPEQGRAPDEVVTLEI